MTENNKIKRTDRKRKYEMDPYSLLFFLILKIWFNDGRGSHHAGRNSNWTKRKFKKTTRCRNGSTTNKGKVKIDANLKRRPETKKRMKRIRFFLWKYRFFEKNFFFVKKKQIAELERLGSRRATACRPGTSSTRSDPSTTCATERPPRRPSTLVTGPFLGERERERERVGWLRIGTLRLTVHVEGRYLITYSVPMTKMAGVPS